MKESKFLVILALVSGLFLGGCTSSTSTSSCTSTSSSSNCQLPATSSSSNALQLQFVDSYYNDPNSANAWSTISASNLNSGSIPNINVYPSYNTLNNTNALSSAAAALNQTGTCPLNSASSACQVSGFNQVPYIEFLPQSGTSYSYQYNIITTTNGVQSINQGSISTVSIVPSTTSSAGRAIIPLSDAFLGSFYFGQVAQQLPGTTITGQLSITASSNTQSGTPFVIKFTSIYSLQNRNYQTAVACAMENFSLQNRWQYYLNPSSSSCLAIDGTISPACTASTSTSCISSGAAGSFPTKTIARTTQPQTNLPLVVAQDISGQSANPMNVMVRFCQSAPVITINETMFFELPFDGVQFQSTGIVSPNRGNTFYTNDITLNSNTDFGINVTLGGQPINPTTSGNLDYYLPNGYPEAPIAATPVSNFDLAFSANLTQSSSYQEVNNISMIYPLKPVCQEIQNTPYEPLVDLFSTARSTTVSNGGQFMTCDLDTTPIASAINKSYTKANLAGLSPAPLDTWNQAFSYAPYRQQKNELGHLYGIKQLTFNVSATFELISLNSDGSIQMSNGNPVIYSAGGNSCNGDGTSNWTTVNKSLTYTIFDNSSSLYQAIPGLNGILNLFNSSNTQVYPYMKINNENLNANSIRHIY